MSRPPQIETVMKKQTRSAVLCSFGLKTGTAAGLLEITHWTLNTIDNQYCIAGAGQLPPAKTILLI